MSLGAHSDGLSFIEIKELWNLDSIAVGLHGVSCLPWDVLTAACLTGGDLAFACIPPRAERTHCLHRSPSLSESFHCYSRPPPLILAVARYHSPSGTRRHPLILLSPLHITCHLAVSDRILLHFPAFLLCPFLYYFLDLVQILAFMLLPNRFSTALLKTINEY